MTAQTETNKRNIPSLNAIVRSLVEQETLAHPFGLVETLPVVIFPKLVIYILTSWMKIIPLDA